MSSESASLFTRQRTALIVGALRDGASQAEAAEEAGIGLSTLKLWLARGQRQPRSRYGTFARTVELVSFMRRGVAFVHFVPTRERGAQRLLTIPLEGAALDALPKALRNAIELGEVVPVEVSVKFERARGETVENEG